jgi:hypothetical protein
MKAITWHSPSAARINNKVITSCLPLCASPFCDMHYHHSIWIRNVLDRRRLKLIGSLREVKEIDCEYSCIPTCYNAVLDEPYKEDWLAGSVVCPRVLPCMDWYLLSSIRSESRLVLETPFLPQQICRKKSALSIFLSQHIYRTNMLKIVGWIGWNRFDPHEPYMFGSKNVRVGSDPVADIRSRCGYVFAWKSWNPKLQCSQVKFLS